MHAIIDVTYLLRSIKMEERKIVKITDTVLMTVLPIIVVAVNILSFVVWFFDDIEEYFFVPALSIICLVMTVGMCALVIKCRNYKKDSGMLNLLTLVFLIVYEIVYIINLDNIVPMTTAGEIACILGVAIAPFLTISYLFEYMMVKTKMLEVEKNPKTALLLPFILVAASLVGLVVGYSGIFNSSSDNGSDYDPNNIHTCIVCGEDKYIPKTTGSYWVCHDCK